MFKCMHTGAAEGLALGHAAHVVLVIELALIATLAQATQPVDAHGRLGCCG